MINRRHFLSVLGASVAAGGFSRVWGAARKSGTPDLRIGLLSDTHIALGPRTQPREATRLFRHALEYFRDRHVDGVLISGDLTQSGLETEFKAFAETWFDVFPGNQLPDGSPVAPLFLYGDHDAEARFYNDRLKRTFAKAGVALPRSLSQGELRKELWEKYLKEPWSPLRHVRVKGYDFVLSSFMREGGKSAPSDLPARLAALKLDPGRPFFYAQHRYIGGTYLSDEEMWGGDNGVARKALERYPNAVAFTGHTHYMLTDDRTVWLGKFACVNNGALASAAVGRQRENGAAISWYKKDYMRETQMPGVNSRRGHGGMVMSVFGETIVLERRDFGCDAALGPDLVFSASPESRSRFSGAARAAKNPVPAFRQPAAIRLSRGPGKNRKGETLEQITVHFPVVGPKGDCPRAFDYVVRALDRKGQVVKEKRVYSPHINLPPDRDAAEASCVFSVAEVEGAATFTVAPANCWRREGPCLSCARKDV